MRPGFTLIELMIVVAMIAILAAIGIPTLAAINHKGRCVEWSADYKHLICHTGFDGKEVCVHQPGSCTKWESER